MSETKDKFEFAATIDKNTAYSTYYNDNFAQSGVPKTHDLERYLNDPQGEIDGICSLSKYYYYKVGNIMRTVNIIRDFGITEVKEDYGKGSTRAKKVIDDYKYRMNIMRFLKDCLHELALTGNLVVYDRDGKYLDILPLSVIEVSDLIINGKAQLKFDHSKFNETYDFMSGADRAQLKNAYPEEVRKAQKNGGYTDLNIENTYFIKTNCSRYEKHGVPFLLPAFPDLAQKTIMKEAEKSTAAGIIDQVFHVKVGDKENPPKRGEIEFYTELFAGNRGSIRVTTPYNVDLAWIAPEADIFGEEKFLEVDKDILSSLGVSVTLLRGDGGGNYSDGMINLTGLIKTIESIREEIPRMLEDLYRKELVHNGISEDKTPKVSFNDVEIDKTIRIQMVQWLFQSAGLPYEVLFDELGYNFEVMKDKREQENKDKVEDVFKLRQQPFQGDGNVDTEKKNGAPEKDESERKSDKNQSNNGQPRSGMKKIKEE